MNLENKVIIITGASSGIGEATARLLAKHGAKVTLAARREDRLKKLASEIGEENALIAVTDVTNPEQVASMVEETIKKFGRVDVLVNNAGLMPLSLMSNLHIEEWHRMVDVNIKGVLNCVGSTLPQMLKQSSGHIINISSVAGRRVFPGAAVYCATKFAVNALSEGLRMELAPHKNIRVTSIQPGAVATELTEHITDEQIIKGLEERFKKLEPLESADIAESIYYAISQPNRVNINEVLVLPRQQDM